jgi:hypothetical protein
MHIALDAYYLQAIGVALAIAFAFSRNRKIDIFPLAVVGAWLIGVCAIYFKYGNDQANFYSNDQNVHLENIRIYIENDGFNFQGIIPLRYLITYPTYLLSKIGFDEILILKAIQIVSLIGIYFVSKKILLSKGLPLKLWHFAFIASPLMIFFSVLALRDLTLGLFTISYIFERKIKRRAFIIALVFLLKPHLAISLLFGTFALALFRVVRTSLNYYVAFLFLGFSYFLGAVSYSIGTYFKDGFYPGFPRELFSQAKISQLALNFSGLQFFSFVNDPTFPSVTTPTHLLLLARIVLFDTFLIPLSFIFISVFLLRYLKNEAFLLISSFVFFLGLVSQTDFNSTRQNIPFLAVMGIVSVVNIEAALRLRRKGLLSQS